jgi:hypothetical protein
VPFRLAKEAERIAREHDFTDRPIIAQLRTLM